MTREDLVSEMLRQSGQSSCADSPVARLYMGRVLDLARLQQVGAPEGCDEVLDWRNFGRLRGEGWEVHLFCARFPSAPLPVNLEAEEVVHVHHVNHVALEDTSRGSRFVPNVRWLVSMALCYLRGDDVSFHDVGKIGLDDHRLWGLKP